MSLAIWQGFDHYWQREPHRLNRFGSYIDISKSQGEQVEGMFHTTMQIGRFPPDVCHTHSMLHSAGTDTTRAVHGSVSLTVGAPLGERVEQDGEPVTCQLPSGDLSAEVIMRGFELDCTHSHGFQTRGFGFQITDIQIHKEEDGASISFVPRFFIYADRSPDPFTQPNHLMWRLLPFPKGLEPRTPDHYEYAMTLHYTVLYDQQDRMAVTRHTIQEGPLKSRYIGPGSGRVVNPRQLEGQPGHYPHATTGIRGFRWELHHWDRTRWDGRYLRKVECMIDGQTYDPESGVMSISPKMEFNNFGGRQGREQVRIWIEYLRARRGKNNQNRLRTLVRSLRGSYGFLAEYRMDVSLLQFVEDTDATVSHLYNVIRKATRVAHPFRF